MPRNKFGRHLVLPSNPWRKTKRKNLALVCFALGDAVVRILTSRRAVDGEIVHHVRDVVTGRQDFVGETWLRPLAY